MLSKINFIIIILTGLLLCVNFITAYGGPQWYDSYKDGIDAMKSGNWEQAISMFQNALKFENKDSNKKRVGTMFIKYFPHRELGICFYNLGNNDRAGEQLKISLEQSFSKRAKEYLDNLGGVPIEGQSAQSTTTSPSTTEPIRPKNKIARDRDKQKLIVGDRLSVAVLPFETKGINTELGEINLLDKMITEFYQLNRFKVIERSQLEKILEEQKLGLSGIIDQTTAVEVGKATGVDVVVFGSITCDGRSVSIDARLVDTKTAEIITSKDAFSKDLQLINLSKMIADVSRKISMDLPIVNGMVIQLDSNSIMIDIGSSHGIKKGMKCHVYRIGAPIIHPVSGDTLDTKKDLICEVQVVNAFEGYSTASVIQYKKGLPEIGDKVQTK